MRPSSAVDERSAMSTVSADKKRTPAEIARRKGAEPIVCLTAYSTPMARLLDPIADLLLVGDSLGMVIYGFESTLPVTLEMMIAHGAAAVRGAKRACVIVDMPFGSYQESPAQAFKSAARIMAETGAGGVKIEGGEAMAETVRFLVERGIPVLGHIGLQPQSVNVIGGFRAQGRNEAEAARVMADARAGAQAGCFAIVIERHHRAGGAPRHRSRPCPDHRHRCLARLRRTDSGHRGSAGVVRHAAAALRQALRRTRAHDHRRRDRLCRRRARAPLPRTRALLRPQSARPERDRP